MKKLTVLSFVVAVAGLLNVGCTASAGIHTSDATKLDNTQQIAYVGQPPK